MATSAHPSQIRNPDALFIGGDWTKPVSGSTIDVLNSADEEVFVTVAEAQAGDVDRAVAAAREAFDRGPWPRMTSQERAVYLNRIADEWDKRGEALADAWTSESGVLRTMSNYGAMGVARVFRYYAGLATSYAWEEQHVSSSGDIALLTREPVGVVAAIIPWNIPSMLMAYKAAPALIAGCAIIIKASPEAPSAPYLLAEICEDVGLPAGVVNVLTADREVSELLVRNPGVDKVSFTGSTAAGRKIASVCGERIARVTLELGGKSPAIILDDYDVAKAAATIARAAPMMTGQVCSSITRIIVPRARQADLVEALTAQLGQVRVGDPFDAASHMGPLASAAQRDRVTSYIEKGKAQGARLALGGGRPAHLSRGYYVEPTVFADVDNRSAIAQEEIFGPVLSVIPASSEEEAIDIANDTIFGLNSTIFTDDRDRGYAVARRIRAGSVGINGNKADFSVAFGGFKQSGLGREGGTEGLAAYLETKMIILDEKPGMDMPA